MTPQAKHHDDMQIAAWAESDAAITALANSTTPPTTHQGKVALEAFRQAGRPRLDGNQSTTGRSPRRQVRLPAQLNDALDTYAAEHGITPSEIIRTAITRYLTEQSVA